MTPEEWLAAGLKFAAALPVLRWPLAGAVIAILADNLDVVVMNYVDLGGGGIRNYHAFDKWTDLFALATYFIVTLRWEGRDRAVAHAPHADVDVARGELRRGRPVHGGLAQGPEPAG